MSAQVIRDALDNAAKVIAANPEKARVKSAPAVATLKSGLTFAVTGPNGEAIETHMPKGVGGDGLSPQPGWLLRAALASCTGTVIALRAAQFGIALDRLDVSVESQSDTRGMIGLDDKVSAALFAWRTVVHIGSADATDAELEALVRWADAHSPVACTMRGALPSEIEVVVV